MLKIIDTHAHYDDKAFDGDRDELISSLPSHGIIYAVNVGASYKGAVKSVRLAEKYPHIYAACGIHPDDTGYFETRLSASKSADDVSSDRSAADTDKDTDSETDEEGFALITGVKSTDKSTDKSTSLAASDDKCTNEKAALAVSEEERIAALAQIRALAAHPKCVAVGEIGLDYHWMVQPKEVQKRWFIAQLQLALEMGKPINVHSRDAAQDTFDIIREYHYKQLGQTGSGKSKSKGIIHCYSGSPEMAREYVRMGYHLGIGGVVTYKNGRVLKEVVKSVPIEYLVTETDCPYLAPAGHRGQRNNSAYLPLVVETIAQLKEMDTEEAAAVLFENACRVYDLPRFAG